MVIKGEQMRAKRCKICNCSFHPTEVLQPTCNSMKCIYEYGRRHLKQSGFKKRGKVKIKKSDVIDENYLSWLATQPCVISNQRSPRGAGATDMHIHHINGRCKGRNDYETVPLLGFLHSWGNKAYHNIGQDEYKKMIKEEYGLDIRCSIKEFFMMKARDFRERYREINEN